MFTYNKAETAVMVYANINEKPDLPKLIKKAAEKVTYRKVEDEVFLWVTLKTKKEKADVCNILQWYEEEQMSKPDWDKKWKAAKAIRDGVTEEDSGSETKSEPKKAKKPAAKKTTKKKSAKSAEKKPAAKKTAAKKTTKASTKTKKAA